MEEPTPEHHLAEPSEKLILLVDDDESLLDLMEHIIRREGFRTERASDGAEALRKADALTPDLILMDLMLPGKGGYEVVRDLQATDAARVPVVVITGRTIDRKNMEMIKNEPNVRDFMQSPAPDHALATALHSCSRPAPEINRATDRGPLGGGPF